MQVFSKQFNEFILTDVEKLDSEDLYDLEETATMLISFLDKLKYTKYEKLFILSHIINYFGEE